MKKRMPKVLLVLALVCVLAIGAAVATFAADVTEDTDYGDGQVIDGSEGWNTADGDNYLITEDGTIVTFTNNPFIRDTDNWSNFVFETVSSDEADGITLRADAWAWTYGDGINTPEWNVSYSWDFDYDDFYAICTENTEITLTAYRVDEDSIVIFLIEFGDSDYYEIYGITYPDGIPSELWFHLGADGGSITVNSVEYWECVDIVDITVDSVDTTELLYDSYLYLDGIEITVTNEKGETETLTIEDGEATDSYGNQILANLYFEDRGEYIRQGSRLYFCGDAVLEFEVNERYGRYATWFETDIAFEVREPEVSDVEAAGVTELELNEIYTADIANAGDWVWYSYTPEKDGYYIFKSFNNEQTDHVDTYVEIYYESDGVLLSYGENDDGSDNNNFLLKSYLTAGTTYYYKTRGYDKYDVGLFDVSLTEGAVIKSISAGDLSATEFTQYADSLNLTETEVTITYENGTTVVVTMEGNRASDEFGNYIYAGVEYEGVLYDELVMPAGEYTVVFYTDDGSATDETKKITVVAIEDTEYYCEIEYIDTEYLVEVGTGAMVWYAFTPAEDGQYYFAFTCDTDAVDYEFWRNTPRYYYSDSEEGGVIYAYYVEHAYDEENWEGIYVEDGDYTWDVYELTAGVTYYIPAYFYEYDEEDVAATLSMIAGQIGHEHTYNNAEDTIDWVWSEDHLSATATIYCDGCGEALSGTAVVTTETVEATATTDGSITYTATVTLNGTVYKKEYVEIISATGEETPTEAPTETPTEAPTEAPTDGTATPANATPSGQLSPEEGDVSVWGYIAILLGAAAAAVVLAKKKANA